MRKSVLIVDDSRVATVTLKRLLEPHGAAVDVAESGPEALEYLRLNVPPAVVFLDHMMPGMDGFEVLTLIKRDPRLVAVPVVMYTSQEGENYLGQALARGAVAVLRKPPSPISLLHILEQLGLVAEPMVVRPVAEVAAGAATGGARGVTPMSVQPMPARTRRPVHPEAAPAAATPVAPGPPAEAAVTEDPSSGWGVLWVALYTLLLLAPAVWLFQQYRTTEQARAMLAQENRTLAARVAATVATPPTPQATPSAEPGATPPPTRWRETLTWAVNLRNQYAYDQLPLDDQRLGLVRELVTRLTQNGFEGLVRLETHVGEFCLTRDGYGGFKLPEPTAPIADCEIVDYTAEQAVTLGRRQSPAFSRFLLTQSNQRTPVRVEVVSHGNQRPLANYPNVSALRTAGEWNAIAARNQRVQIAIVPSADEK